MPLLKITNFVKILLGDDYMNWNNLTERAQRAILIAQEEAHSLW